MIGVTRSIALPTKTRVAQGAGSWVGRLLHLEPQVTRSPTDREVLTMNVGLAAVVTATASPTPVGPATAAVTALQVVTLVLALLGLIVSVVALTSRVVA